MFHRVATWVVVGIVAIVLILFVPHAGFIQHWFALHTGIRNGGPDPYYNFWSGIGSDLGEITLITAVIMAAQHANCHTQHCWRLTSHKMVDPLTKVEYRQCHKHHPLIPTAHAHKRFWQHNFTKEHLDTVRDRVVAAAQNP